MQRNVTIRPAERGRLQKWRSADVGRVSSLGVVGRVRTERLHLATLLAVSVVALAGCGSNSSGTAATTDEGQSIQPEASAS